MDPAALQAEHFRDVIEPHAVGVAVDEEHRRFGGLELVGAEVVRFQGRRFDVLDKIGNSSGVGLSFLYSVSMGEPLNASGGDVRECVEPFFDPAVAGGKRPKC